MFSAAEFAIISTRNVLQVYSPGQLLFGRNIILHIKQNVDWELIRQQKLA